VIIGADHTVSQFGNRYHRDTDGGVTTMQVSDVREHLACVCPRRSAETNTVESRSNPLLEVGDETICAVNTAHVPGFGGVTPMRVG
jgi:hypothetical protein